LEITKKHYNFAKNIKMKKFIIIIVLSVFSFVAYSQLNVELYKVEPNTTNRILRIENGGRYIVHLDDGDAKFYFSIKNLENKNKTYKIRKANPQFVPGVVEVKVCAPVTILSPEGLCVEGDETRPFTMTSGEEKSTYVSFYQELSGTSSIEIIVYTGDIETATDDEKISFTISFTTENSEIPHQQINSFYIFPNPATNTFTINADYSQKIDIEVYNVLGKQILKASPKFGSSYIVDCSKWEKGYYFCKFVNNGKVLKTLKLVVTK